MARRDETPRDLLFGLLALHTGLIDQDQLVAAFGVWSRNKGKTLAEILVERGSIDEDDRSALKVMAEKQLKRHDGDTEKSLAAVAVGPSTREKLVAIGDIELDASVAFVGTHASSDDTYATAAFGTATSEGHRFRILRPHAQGGLGAVYVALDSELNREVALKQMLDHHADNELSRTRFLIEAKITGGLEHPGIIPIYGLGHYGDGRPYYAMRFIRGETLKEALAGFHSDESLQRDPGKKSLALRKLLRRFVDVCNAIDYAHGRGILHRDLKPGNVIVGRHGETLVADWGLAKVMGRVDAQARTDERTLMPSSMSGSVETLPGSAIGTPSYMSPEQAVGDLEKLGPHSDVYSLGATLYSLLTGKPPFEGSDLGTIFREVQKGAFPPPRQLDPTIDRALEAICLKAMALNPADRHASARALAEDIERWSADEPTSAWSEPFSVRSRRWMRRNRTAVATLAVAVLATLFGTAAVLAVQTRANADLKKSNDALAASNAKETQANHELKKSNDALADAKDREAARFTLAQDAIRLFHGEVGDDLVLKEDKFKPLRDKLLKGAADFYGKLEKLLEGQTDHASRKSLGQAYFDLGRLSAKIGDKTKALEAHRKALAIRRELTATPPTEIEARIAIAWSLFESAFLLSQTGKLTDAQASYEEAHSLLKELPRSGTGSEAYRNLLARVHAGIAIVLSLTGKPADAMEEYREAVAIQRELANANPAVTEFRGRLANGYTGIAALLSQSGKTAEALEYCHKALKIQRELADANPLVTEFRRDLAISHDNIGLLLSQTGKLAEAMQWKRKALAIQQELADANPAVTEFRDRLANGYTGIAALLSQSGKPVEALESFSKALAIQQELANANPAVTEFRGHLAISHSNIGILLSQTGKPAEALESYSKALAIQRELVNANPAVTEFRGHLAKIYHDTGLLLSQTGKPAEALEYYRKALAIQQELVTANPSITEFRRLLAISHNNLGLLLSQSGKPAEALDCYRKALAIQQELANDNPSITEFRRLLAISHNNLGLLLAETGKPAEGLEFYRKAMAIQQELADANPAVTEFRVDLARNHLDIGSLHLNAGRLVEAAEEFASEAAIREKLVDENPAFPLFRNDLAHCLNNTAALLLRLQKTTEARARSQRAVSLLEKLIEADSKTPSYRCQLAEGLLRLGQGRQADGELAAALADWKRAVGLYQAIPDLNNESTYLHGCCHAAIAMLAGKAGSSVSAEEGETRSLEAMTLLTKAAGMGYRDPSTYRNEPTLEALRSRADFQTLMKTLESPSRPAPTGDAPK